LPQRRAYRPAIDANEFENALVNYGVVLLHAHMEQCIKGAIEARCVRCTDLELRTLTLSIKDKETGKIGIASLKDTLGRFSKAYKLMFKAHLDASGVGDGDDSSWESVKKPARNSRSLWTASDLQPC